MELERWRHQKQTRRVGTQGKAREVTTTFKLAGFEVPFDAHPVIQGLERQMYVLAGLHLDDHQPPVVIQCEQIQNAARTRRELRGLAVQGRVANTGVQAASRAANLRFEPSLGMAPEEGVGAIGCARIAEAAEPASQSLDFRKLSDAGGVAIIKPEK